MLILQSQKSSHFHNVFSSLYKTSGFSFFFFGLAIWMASPIVGIVPLLLFAQMHLSRKVVKGVNLKRPSGIIIIILLLVLFTTTIASSTYPIVSDLAFYVSVFQNLGSGSSFWEYMSERGMEPVSFIIPYIMKSTFGIDAGFFILLQSLTLNLAFILIALIYLPSFYPSAILLNTISTTYFLQLFLMRQYYSFIFLALFIFSPRLSLRIIFASLAMITHSSSAFFISILVFCQFLFEDDSNRKNRIPTLVDEVLRLSRGRFFILIFPLFLAASTIFVFSLIGSNLAVLDSFLPTYSQRFEFYGSGRQLGLTEDLWKSAIFDFVFLSVAIIFVNFKDLTRVPYRWVVGYLTCLVSLILFYFYLPLFGRSFYMLIGLSGFFYTFIFLSNDLNIIRRKSNARILSAILILAILTKVLYYYYRITFSSMTGSSDILNGNSLGASIVDYFVHLHGLLVGF